MDAHRRCNVCAARRDYDAGETAPEGWPQEAIIEVSARCNLRCVMCPISYDPRYQPGSGRPALLTPQLFERLRPLFPTLLRADLFGLGEPVLNPHLTDFIGELHAAGVEVRFTTNATLIDDERAEAFARAGADSISVSIDGASAGTYETIRRGGRFEGVLRGLEALCRARRRHGRPRVTVSFRRHGHERPRDPPAGGPLPRDRGGGGQRGAPLRLGGREPGAGGALPAGSPGRSGSVLRRLHPRALSERGSPPPVAAGRRRHRPGLGPDRAGARSASTAGPGRRPAGSAAAAVGVGWAVPWSISADWRRASTAWRSCPKGLPRPPTVWNGWRFDGSGERCGAGSESRPAGTSRQEPHAGTGNLAVSSLTASALRCSAWRSSAVRSISMIPSTPLRPSFTGTPM